MADKKKMSVDDILAACRGNAPDGAASSAAKKPATPSESESGPGEKKSPSAPTGKKSGDMSVADILAAARGGQAAESKEEPAAKKPAIESETASGSGGKKSSAAPTGKKSGDMSLADILAAARGGQAAESKEESKPKPKPKPKSKPAAAKPAAKAFSAAGAKSAPSRSRGSSSILTAAPTSGKLGPMSKAEAATKGIDVSKPVARPVAPPMPAKPEYAKSRGHVVKSPDGERRGVLIGLAAGFAAGVSVCVSSFLGVGFSAMAAVGGLWSLGLARFMFPNILTEPPSKFKVGFPGDFAPDTVTTRFKAQYGVWIVHAEYDGKPMVTALKSVCTHLGCTPNWLEGEQKFKCPCHGSGFYKDGINFEGPAPRPLERYAIRKADDGQLEIDKSKTFQQEMGQWNDPASFYAV